MLTTLTHASYVFLLDESSGVQALFPMRFVPVALARGMKRRCAAAWPDRNLRLADWYVRLKDGEPEAVINETYRLLHVDAQGHFESAAAPADSGWPTPAERQRMRALLFEPEAPTA